MSEQQQTPVRSVVPGDAPVVAAHRVGEPKRIAEILEVPGDPGRPHFRLRWDDGTESVLDLGCDAIGRHTVPG